MDGIKRIRHPEEVAKRPSRRTAGLDPARHPSLAPSPLLEERGEQQAGGRVEIMVDGPSATVGEALQKLWSIHAGLRDRVLTEQGHVRPHVNVFVNSEVVRRDQVLQNEISGDTEICIMPAVSGG